VVVVVVVVVQAGDETVQPLACGRQRPIDAGRRATMQPSASVRSCAALLYHVMG
jgi:hypothetical protein